MTWNFPKLEFLNRKWLFWQVLVPIGAPVLISIVVAYLWQTVQPKFEIHWDVVFDVTPWALTFYTITLIGATMNDLWPKAGIHPVLAWSIVLVGLSVAFYAGLIVIARHDPAFVPGIRIYIVAIVLLTVSVFLCHQATKV